MNSKSKKIRYIITVMALAGLIGNPMLEGATVVATTLPTESESTEESEAPLPEALEPAQDTEESEETKSEDTPDRSASAEEIPPPASSTSIPEEPTLPADVASPEQSTAEAAPKMTGTMWGGVDFEWNTTTGELTLFGGTITNPNVLPIDRWLINHIKFEGAVTVGGSGSLSGLFRSMTSLTAIENLTYLNTSGATDMSSMFVLAGNLTSLDLSSFDTSSVTNMASMFVSTSSLTSLDLTSFETSTVTSMTGMFGGASSLTNLDLSTFDTSAVISMDHMFWEASSLISLDLSSFNIASGTNIANMFLGTDSLRELKLGSGISRLNGTGLPTISTTSGEFTGFWQNVGTGSTDRPNGTTILSSAGLMNGFNSSMADTFVWQRVVPKMWGEVEYDWNATTGELTLFGGTIINPDALPIDRWRINHIKFEGTVTVGGSGSLARLFQNMTNLTAIENLTYLNTSGVTDMNHMFSGAARLTNLELSSFDTSAVTHMYSMFATTSALTKLDVSSFNTTAVTDMSGMFSGTWALTNLDLSSFNTTTVTDMSSMFNGASRLTSLDLSNFDTSAVTNMFSMFRGTSNLTSLDLSAFNTSAVMDMSGMFWSMSSLTSLDLSNFDTSSVENMWQMFAHASSLTSLDLSSFDTSSVTSMTSMFSGASSLTSLDLSSFDITSGTSITNMFFNTASLRELKLGSGISRLNGTGLPTISTTSGEFTGFWQNVGTGSAAQPNGTNVLTSTGLMQSFNPSMADTFVWQRTLPKVWGDVEYDYDETSKTLTLEGGTITNPSDFDSAIRSEVEHIVFQGDVNVGGSKSLSTLFDGFQNLRDIQNLEKLDTSGVTDMSWMFTGTSSLTSLDLSSFDTSAVTNMFAMFDSAESLTSLNLSSFDTSDVINMQSMFSDARSLSSLDLSSFNTSSVTTMQSMFSDTSSLTRLDLSSFDTGSVINMSWMFSGANSLTHLDLSSFETSSVTTMQDMFTGASNLTRLDLPSFDTSAVDDARFGLNFGGLNALVELRLGDNTAIDLSNLPEFTTSAGYLNWWAREGEANNWLDSHQLMNLSASPGQAAGTWRRVPYQTKVEAKDSTLAVGDTWQAKDNFVRAINREGDEVPFEDVTVTGKVDTTKAGIYEVTYAYDGVSATAKVTVKAEEENGNGNGNGNNNSGENENGQDKDDSPSNNETDEDKVSDSDDTRGDEKQSQQEEPDLNAASRDKLPETGEIAGMLSWLGLGSLAVAMLLWYKRRCKK